MRREKQIVKSRLSPNTKKMKGSGGGSGWGLETKQKPKQLMQVCLSVYKMCLSVYHIFHFRTTCDLE